MHSLTKRTSYPSIDYRQGCRWLLGQVATKPNEPPVWNSTTTNKGTIHVAFEGGGGTAQPVYKRILT